MSAESVTNGDRVLGNEVAAVLLIQVVYPVKIDLRFDENIRFNIQLHANCGMQLKMIGSGDHGTGIRADLSDATGLVKVKGQSGAANSALDHGNDSAGACSWLIYSIKVIKRRTSVQSSSWQVIGLSKTERVLRIHSKVRQYHEISANHAKCAADSRSRFAESRDVIEDLLGRTARGSPSAIVRAAYSKICTYALRFGLIYAGEQE